MKTIRALLLVVAWIACPVSASEATRKYYADGNYLDMVIASYSYRCLLNQKIDSAVESFDGSAIIVSDRGYLPTVELEHCNPKKALRVLSIPDKVGFLADINLSKNIYIALDFISVRPITYLATIAHLKSTRNLVTLDGAYLQGKKLAEMRKHSFTSSGVAGAAIISPDGRYVSPAGQVDCGIYANPGVWDITKNKRVIADDDACYALFGIKEKF